MNQMYATVVKCVQTSQNDYTDVRHTKEIYPHTTIGALLTWASNKVGRDVTICDLIFSYGEEVEG